MTVDQYIQAVEMILPLLDPKGAPTIIGYLKMIQTAYDTYESGGVATIGPVEIAAFNTNDKVSLQIQKG